LLEETWLNSIGIKICEVIFTSSSSLQTNRLTEKNMLAYPFEDSRSFPCLNTEPNKNSSHFQHFNPVLWIRITLMRTVYGFDYQPAHRLILYKFYLVICKSMRIWIRIQPITLMRIRFTKMTLIRTQNTALMTLFLR
jgi:hypothetical protein